MELRQGSARLEQGRTPPGVLHGITYAKIANDVAADKQGFAVQWAVWKQVPAFEACAHDDCSTGIGGATPDQL